MNRFAIGAQLTPAGWIGWFRKVHRAENEIVRKNGEPVIYGSRIEAKEGAAEAFLRYLNSEMVRDGETLSTGVRAAAEALFCKQRGREKRIAVERRSVRA